MTTPAVSVVLPAHDRAAVVGRAIRSVLDQTFRDLELVVVDDASTDDTAEVLARFAAEDARVRIVRSDDNLGPAGARNLGIKETRGALVAFQDSDDRWLPDKLARQVDTLERAGDSDACYCGAIYFAPEECYYLPAAAFAPYEGDLRRACLRDNPVTPQCLLVSRARLFEAGLFDPALRIRVDWDLTIRLAALTPFAFVPDPLVIIYRTPGSVSTHTLRNARFREHLLERYAGMFAGDPGARMRQHYVAGSLFARSGLHGRAASHFARAFALRPGPRSLARLLLSGARSTVSPGARHDAC